MSEQQFSAPRSQPKDPDIAFLIELVGGFFGLLGLGYIYTGRTEDGLVRLLVWALIIWGGWVMAILLAAILIGCLIMPLLLVGQVAVPIWSASTLKKSMENQPAV